MARRNNPSRSTATGLHRPVSNQSADARSLLRILREHDVKSVQELLQRSGLSSSRLSSASALLQAKRLIEPLPGRRNKTDRRFIYPRINANHGYVAGVDIGGTNLRVALADMKGSICGKWSATTKGSASAEMVVAQISKGVEHLLEQTAIPRSSLLAIAAGAPGVTNREAGIVFATSYLKGWKDVPLARLLKSKLHIPAAVENDVKLAAIGENWAGAARGVRDFVFLAIGTGIAAGIFVNGQLVHGPEWVAGEVGYMIVPGTPDVAAREGMPGALESMIGGEGLKQQWLRARGNKRSNGRRDLSATGIFYHALAGDRLAKSILEGSARILATAIYNISTVLNCSLFVLGGGVGMSAPLLAATQKVLEPYSQPSRPNLISSMLGQDAQLIGAIRLALDQAESEIDLRLSGAQ
jgi:predicted NBD/HSP70 family sugar kinase